MARAFLRYQPGKPGERRIPIEASLLVGRTDDCGLVIDDPAASRHHLEILTAGDGYTWRDLGSTNGTIVNGKRAHSGALKDGDRIEIGETELLVEIEPAPPGASGDSGAAPAGLTVHGALLDDDAALSLPPEEGRACALLRAVYAVSNEIATTYEPCKLVDRILQTTVQAVEAKRGAIFFGDAATGELMPCSVCGRFHTIVDRVLGRAGPGEINISQSVAHSVLRGGESVLYQDIGATHARSSESIKALRLRSIICVPLRGKFGIMGVLYIDTDQPGHHYTRDDLLLSTAVGNSAGLALENATMHQQLLEKQKIEQEIEHAAAIQQGFLIAEWPPGSDRLEVYGETRPAKAVGGDYYDFVELDADRVALLIGDVSGKGIAAALSMAQILAEFRLLIRAAASPRAILASLNESLFKRSKRGVFSSLCLLVLDLRSGSIVWANAGHPPPLRIGTQGTAFLPEASGPPAGVIADGTWVDQEARIEPGETILLYTDGVVEAPAAAPADRWDAYGFERFARHAATCAGRSPRELVTAIAGDVISFCRPEPPHDDVTMIAARYRP